MLDGAMYRVKTGDWPDWESVEQCSCGYDFGKVEEMPVRCPACNRETIELVSIICDGCGAPIYPGWYVYTDMLGVDYCAACVNKHPEWDVCDD